MEVVAVSTTITTTTLVLVLVARFLLVPQSVLRAGSTSSSRPLLL